MKIQFTSLFIFLIILQSNAQQFHWGMAIDHQGFGASPSHTLVDYDNNLLTFGSFAVLGPQIDLDPDPIDSFVVSSFLFDSYIAKYSQTDGSLLWASGVGGDVNGSFSPRSIVIDKSNNHLFVGQLSGTVDIDFGPNINNVTSSLNYGHELIIKYDSSFEYVQHIMIGGINNFGGLAIRSIECDLQNNYYFLGNYFDSVDFDPGINQYLLVGDSGRIELFLAKYDQNFNLLWVDTFTTKAQMGPNFGIEFLKFDPVSGNLILTGNYSGTDTIDLDPGAGQSLFYNEFDESSFTAIYDTAGNFIRMWKTFSDFANDIDGMTTDDNGYIYTMVEFEDTLYLHNFFSPPYLVSTFPDVGYGIVKYDISGNYISSSIIYSQIEPDFDLMLEKDGYIYLSGDLSNGNLDVDPSSGVYMISANDESYFLLCYSSLLGNNSFHWGFSDPNSNSSNQQFCISEDHTLFVSGAFQDSLDCDPSSSTYYLHAPAMGYMFHIAYDSTTITSIVDRIDVLNDFIYPNPAKDYLKISVPIQKDMQATILSMQGEVILTIQNLQNEEEIHIEKLSAGMYLLNLKSSSGSHIFKFIKTE